MALLTAAAILNDPTASTWLKDALRSALRRDPVDAANDAAYLARFLDARCNEILDFYPNKVAPR